MTETVYADVLFLIDFSIDFLSLYICGSLLSLKMSLIRLCLAAALGGIFSVASIFTEMSGFLKFSAAALLCVLICLCAFGRKRIVLKSVFFCTVNFTMAGGITALFSFVNSLRRGYDVVIYGNPETVSPRIPVPILLSAAAVFGVFTLCFGFFVKKNGRRKTVSVNICFGEKQETFKGFVDSGNLLCEPISGTPCIIAKAEKIRNIIPKSLYDYLKRDCEGEIPDSASGLRMIPMCTVGKSGVVYALRPDKLCLDGEEKRAYLAFDCEMGEYGGCDLLVPSSLL